MIPAFERAKAVHALDGAATVIGLYPVQYYASSEETFHFVPLNEINSVNEKS
jgi:hypothetical protein